VLTEVLKKVNLPLQTGVRVGRSNGQSTAAVGSKADQNQRMVGHFEHE
jgi:hypothetical protein